MKKIIIGLFVTGLFFACNSNTSETAETSTSSVAQCDVNNVDAAAKCLCDLRAQEANLSDSKDEDKLKEAETKTDDFNDKIDIAIEAGKYTEDELSDAAKKIGCSF